MGVEAYITQEGNNKHAEVYDPADDGRAGNPGLTVYTEDRNPLPMTTVPLLNAAFGFDMNQSTPFSGAADGVHDGTDSVLWTATALSGTWDFASTTQAKAGTKSIDATATGNNSEALLTRSSTIMAGDFIALHGFIYITSWPGTGTKDVRLQLSNGGVDTGVEINLIDYIEIGIVGSWQPFIIPTADFGAGTIDELSIKTISQGGGGAPDYFLDEIDFEEAGGFIDFVYAPGPDEKFTILEIGNVFQTTAAEAVVRDPDLFMGTTALTNGVVAFKTSEGTVFQGFPLTSLFDYLQFPQLKEYTTASSGTKTLTSMVTVIQEPLDGRLQETFTYRIQDDLTGLSKMRVWLFGTIEKV